MNMQDSRANERIQETGKGWYIHYRRPIQGTERRHGNSTWGFTAVWDYEDHGELIDIHPFHWRQENPTATLIGWQRLIGEDLDALLLEAKRGG